MLVCPTILVPGPGQILIAFATVVKTVALLAGRDSLLAGAYHAFNLDWSCVLAPVLTELEPGVGLGDMTPLADATFQALDDGDLVVFHLQVAPESDSELMEVDEEDD